MIVESKSVLPGSTFTVDVMATNFPLVSSFQGSVVWNGDDLFMDPNSPTRITNRGYSGSFPGDWILEVNNGSLEFGWTDPSSAVGLPTGEMAANNILFTLEFSALGNAGTTTQISVSNIPVPIEFATPFFVPIANIQTFVGTINIGGIGFPVAWLGIDADLTSEGVMVSWETAQEVNNDYFEVERKLSDGTYQAVGQVKGAGTSDEPISYAFLDENAPEGVLEYRVRQVDFDGAWTFSNSVEILNRALVFGMYPNPARETLWIEMPLEFRASARLRIFDLAGKEVTSRAINELSLVEISLDKLAVGSYVAELTAPSGLTLRQQFVKVE
ncbi:MAG: T9SS type A sorting domain-containing protein [Bacteroidia bacterium]|nr:T9SS type A sorting domain-containing protein [Bacteroidia bacterium]